jgi:hypothetical protein
MARRTTKADAPIGNIPAQQAQRSGTPGKPGHHEGPAGEAARMVESKWQGASGGRDPLPPAEKEPGKSRGPEAGGMPADPSGIDLNKRTENLVQRSFSRR